MALAIALSRLIEVEVRPQALSVGAQPVASAPAQPQAPAPQLPRTQPESAPPPPAPQPGVAPGRSRGGRTYTVLPGDTLGAISKKAYGTTRHAKAILEANRDVIPSERKMRAGIELRLPNIPR
jgi:nucleoid-associated protein YgaU